MRRSRGWRLCICLAAAVAVVGSDSDAQTAGRPVTEIGFLVGAGVSDADPAGNTNGDGEVSLVVGIRGAHLFFDRLNWFGDGTVTKHGTNLAPGDVEVVVLRTGLEVLFQREKRLRWFVAGSGGWTETDYRANLDFKRALVSGGIGQRLLLRNGTLFRWEARVDRFIGDQGLGGSEITGSQFLVGWSLGLGGPLLDTDGDGVPDPKDLCPSSPRGVAVDATGCTLDADGDLVPDGLDRCANTPKGVPVDASGCPLDADGDGVPDGRDRCPDTPAGAKVDALGCPLDADGDAVPDGLDGCPDTPTDVMVDARGCPVDTDGDGVPNGIDRCFDTPRGAKVGPDGCPLPEPVRSEPRPTPLFPEGKRSLVLEGVRFAVDSATLTGDSAAVLNRVAASLREFPEVRVEVAGHTDSSGSDAHNLQLSKRRADAVREFLIRAGIEPSRLIATGYGESRPIADNSSVAGKARNRRVELTRLN